MHALTGRIGELEKQLSEKEVGYKRERGEMERRNKELSIRLGRMEKVEKEGEEWKRRAEEGEFTVKALREEGVRLGRELERRGREVEELGKGRRYVTRL